jgi:hypothetical protein
MSKTRLSLLPSLVIQSSKNKLEYLDFKIDNPFKRIELFDHDHFTIISLTQDRFLSLGYQGPDSGCLGNYCYDITTKTEFKFDLDKKGFHIIDSTGKFIAASSFGDNNEDLIIEVIEFDKKDPSRIKIKEKLLSGNLPYFERVEQISDNWLLCYYTNGDNKVNIYYRSDSKSSYTLKETLLTNNGFCNLGGINPTFLYGCSSINPNYYVIVWNSGSGSFERYNSNLLICKEKIYVYRLREGVISWYQEKKGLEIKTFNYSQESGYQLVNTQMLKECCSTPTTLGNDHFFCRTKTGIRVFYRNNFNYELAFEVDIPQDPRRYTIPKMFKLLPSRQARKGVISVLTEMISLPKDLLISLVEFF